MSKNRQHLAWLALGIAFGWAVSTFWPSEPALANGTAVASDKFGLAVVPTQPGKSDAIFVLDYITGRLIGAHYNENANDFTQSYFRAINADFNLAGDANAKYAMVPALTVLRGQADFAVYGLYVAELNTRRVNLYAVPFSNVNRANHGQELVPLATFPFGQAATK